MAKKQSGTAQPKGKAEKFTKVERQRKPRILADESDFAWVSGRLLELRERFSAVGNVAVAKATLVAVKKSLTRIGNTVGRIEDMQSKAIERVAKRQKLGEEREARKAVRTKEREEKKLARAQKKFADALAEVNRFRREHGQPELDEQGKEIVKK